MTRRLVVLAISLMGSATEFYGAQVVESPPAERQSRTDTNTRSNNRILVRVESAYGRWEVVESDTVRALTCDGVIQSAVPASGVTLSPEMLVRSRDYIGLVPYYRPRTAEVLVIGLGAGLHATALAQHEVKVLAVEIDPAVVPLAERYFSYVGETTICEGRTFLDRTSRRFDAIVLDTFLGADVPPLLYTQEAFQRMANHLVPNGVLAVHLVARPQHAATAAVTRTIATVFPHVEALRSGYSNELQNIFLFASFDPLALSPRQRADLDNLGFMGDEFITIDTSRAPVLTDNHTNLPQLCRDLSLQHRVGSRSVLGKKP